LEFLPFVLMLLSIFLISVNYTDLPQIVPTHFDIHGQPDEFGTKNELILYPAINFFVYLMITVITFLMAVVKDPRSLINLPQSAKDRLTQNQAEGVRVVVVRRLFALKTVITGMLFYMLRANLETAFGRAEGMGYIPLVFAALLLGVVAYMLIKIFSLILAKPAP